MDVFSERLRGLRETRNISRKTASELCGLTPGAFARYERGVREPSIRTLNAIADGFDVSIDYLCGREK